MMLVAARVPKGLGERMRKVGSRLGDKKGVRLRRFLVRKNFYG